MRPMKHALVMLTVLFTTLVSQIAQAETGVSSWYGNPYHGRKAANGTRYNMYAYTAAHRTLPFGTLVEVTNVSNHKKAIFEITDRGPFIKNRVIDVSKVGAVSLGMIKTGTAKVVVRVLGKKKDLSIKPGPVEQATDLLSSSMKEDVVTDQPSNILPTEIINESLSKEIDKLKINFDKYKTLD